MIVQNDITHQLQLDDVYISFRDSVNSYQVHKGIIFTSDQKTPDHFITSPSVVIRLSYKYYLPKMLSQ